MRFDDDFIRVEGRCYSLVGLGLVWPPPEALFVYVRGGSLGIAVVSPVEHPGATEYRQVSRSQITDEDRAGMTHIARGADYVRAGECPGGAG